MLIPLFIAALSADPGADAAPRGLALRAAKVLTGALEGPGWIDRGVVLVRGGRIQAVGRADEVAVPEGWDLVDLGPSWLMPGMVDLHSHVAGTDQRGVNDLNDMVYQANPGLRAACSVVPGVQPLQVGLAGGVTTVLFIPGSGTNVGGQGVLLKTAPGPYERRLVRDPGSLKIAQGDNPVRWGYGMRRALMNFHLRGITRHGLEYAERWRRHEAGQGPRPERDLQLDVFRALLAGRTQVSAHTQIYQLVLMTMLLFKGEFGLDVYLDHSTFDGFKAAEIASRMEISAICGPRSVSINLSRGSVNDVDGSIQGVAEGWQSRGHQRIGFNTDAPVVPQEELFLQAALGVRYGADDSALLAVRGVTIVPALAAGIDHRVGSLEPGKDADVLVVSGDPSDPRTRVERVFVEGELVYDARRERLF